MFKKSYAEDLPYWQTGESGDKAIQEAKNALTRYGGRITGEGYGMREGEAAFFLQFEMQGETFRYVEPVMQSRTCNEKAAKVQAAASLKHAIKARVNEAVRHGARRAFMDSLLLPNGQMVYQQDNATLARLFAPVTAAPQLQLPPEIYEGELTE